MTGVQKLTLDDIERTTRSVTVTGVDGDITMKREDSGFVGEKYIGLAGVRDPYTIANIDDVIRLTREQNASDTDDGVEQSYSDQDCWESILSDAKPNAASQLITGDDARPKVSMSAGANGTE